MPPTTYDAAGLIAFWAARLEHALLGRFAMHACCQMCGHRAPLDAGALRGRFHPGTMLGEIQRRLRCSRCGARGQVPYRVVIERTHPGGAPYA